MAEAAEKRQKTNESRGLKDAEAFKMKQKRKEEIERKAELNQGHGDSNLKVIFLHYVVLVNTVHVFSLFIQSLFQKLCENCMI